MNNKISDMIASSMGKIQEMVNVNSVKSAKIMG